MKIYEKKNSDVREEALNRLLEEIKDSVEGHYVPTFDVVTELRDMIQRDLTDTISQEFPEYKEFFFSGKTSNVDLKITCGIGKIVKNVDQVTLSFNIENLGEEVAKRVKLVINSFGNTLRNAQEFGDFKYSEDEINGDRRGIFKNNEGLIYPKLPEPVGKIQIDINELASHLDLGIEIVSENMSRKEYFIVISKMPELTNLKRLHDTESDNFHDYELLSRGEYDEIVNRVKLGHGFQR